MALDIEGNFSAPVRRIRLTVAYDGTNYHGFQFQTNGVTIQSCLEDALFQLLGQRVRVIGASRTDTGVHALGNVAVFDTVSRMDAEKFSYALNRWLPEDIRIQKAEEVDPEWHPRKRVSRKTYEYRIYRGEFPMPLRRFYSYFTYRPLDVERMRRGAAYLVGEHDFYSFCQEPSRAQSTVRTLYLVELEEQGPELVIRVQGNGFLYHMVRILAGTLMEVGQGKREPESIREMLSARDRNAAGPTAPACGLTLVGYEFPEDPCGNRNGN